jgi:glycerol-3-phosphate dehydrogenase
VHQVAVREGVELPIVDQIYQVLHHGLDPRSAVDTLMRRPIMREA